MCLIFRRFWGVPSGVLVLLAGVLGAFAGCDKKSVADSPYKVIDTGYWNADLTTLAEPLWLDNERISFTSTESLTPGKGPTRVKVWNMTTGKIVSTDLERLQCVREGQVVFIKKDPSSEQWLYYRGPLENAKKHPAPAPGMRMDNVYDCDWVPMENYSNKPLPHRFKLRGENYVEILEERTKLLGYEKNNRDRRREKETGDLGVKGKIVYHRAANDPGREMPPYSWDGITYSEFLDAYTVGKNYYDPKEPETHSFWILQRNGDLKEIPYPTLHEGQLELYPLKLGYLVEFRNDPIDADPFVNGLYLMQGEQMQRLIAGSILGVQVSPDGCKVAFSHAKKVEDRFWLPKPKNTVKLINFCQENTTP